MKTVFALTGGRSGTRFLTSLLRRNARDCRVFHEPHLDIGNPTMFGRPIYDRAAGAIEPVRRLVRAKRDRIARLAPRTYIETSHAFLKSYWDLAPEYFPELWVMHLIRHPLEVARSEENQEAFLHRWRMPFRHYRGGDGRKYFRWSLTGLEPIFRPFAGAPLSRFQWYFIQWIEIENRAMEFLARFGSSVPCFTLHTPGELNDPDRIGELIRFLGLPHAADPPVIAGIANRTPGRPTRIGGAELEACREVLARIPSERLEIFRREPYASREWRRLLATQ